MPGRARVPESAVSKRSKIPYLITSSARASRKVGIERPRAVAVLRLMMSSNLVGCSIGRSDRLGPFKSLSMYAAERRVTPPMFGSICQEPPSSTNSRPSNTAGGRCGAQRAIMCVRAALKSASERTTIGSKCSLLIAETVEERWSMVPHWTNAVLTRMSTQPVSVAISDRFIPTSVVEGNSDQLRCLLQFIREARRRVLRRKSCLLDDRDF